MRSFEIFTDGSSILSPYLKVGGYAAHITDQQTQKTKMVSGGIFGELATIGRMELNAAVQGILNIPYPNRKAKILVRPDSMYVVNSINTWIKQWHKNDWKNAAGEPIKHVDLMMQLHGLLKVHVIKAEHIKGHSGHPLNELCDKEAYSKASKILEEYCKLNNIPYTPQKK